MPGHNIYRFYIIFRRDLLNIVQNPVLLLSNTLFPVILVFLLGYLTAGNYGAGGVTSYDYYGVTILIFSILNVSMTASNSFMEKSLKSSNLRIMYAPIKPSYIYLGKIAATFIFTSLCFMGFMAFFTLALGVNFGGPNIIYCLVIVLLFNLLSAIIGVFFCCILKSEEITNKILSVAIAGMAVLGGLFFRLDSLGPNIEMMSYLSPVKWVAEVIFRIIYDHDLSLFVPGIVVLTLGSLLLLLGCRLTFRLEDYV